MHYSTNIFNMNYETLYSEIRRKGSFLCVGLDTDINKIPEHLRSEEYPLWSFNKSIIDATAPFCVAYKPNTAFYEAHGAKGWKELEMTVEYIKKEYPEILVICDAKRGDIGNTAGLYARAFYESMNADAVTLAPYMGSDSIAPFLNYDGKWSIVLAMTSNPSAEEFETLELCDGTPLYEKIIRQTMGYVDKNYGPSKERLMFVVGATRAQMLAKIREICPDNFLLVPGVGAQGGSLEEVAKYGLNSHCGLLVNSSRGIIYASKGKDFAEAAAAEAEKLAAQMKTILG